MYKLCRQGKGNGTENDDYIDLSTAVYVKTVQLLENISQQKAFRTFNQNLTLNGFM